MVNNSQEMWRFIYEKYYKKTYAVVLYATRDANLAEDVCHDAFLEAFKNMNKLRDINKIGAWIAAIALNIARTTLKRSKKVVLFEDKTEFVDDKLSLEDAILNQEQEKELHKVIRTLPFEMQQVIILRYFYDMEYEDIAEVLGIRLGTVKSRLNRAKIVLKEKLA